MGGDAQPQILLQLLARLLRHGESPGRAVRRRALGAGRRRTRRGGFDLWDREGPGHIAVEAHAPRPGTPGWPSGATTQRGPRGLEHGFGHAQIIEVNDGVLAGAADPRSLDGAASGY